MLDAWASGAPSSPPAPPETAVGLSWREILAVWLRSAWFIVPTAVAGATGAYAITLTMSPVYEAQAVLLLDRPAAGRLGNAADVQTPDAQQRAAIVHSQLEIIRGGDVVAAVIARLHLADSPMFKPVEGPATRLTRRVEAWFGHPVPVTGASPTSRQSALVQSYLSHLTVAQDPDTYILRVGFRSSDPTLATEIVNAHVAAYLAWLRTQQTEGFDRVRVWLAASVAAAHRRVDAADAAVQRLNEAGVMADIKGQSALDQGLTQLTTDLAEAQATLVKSQARADEIARMQRLGQTAGIAAMSGSPVLQTLQGDYAKALTELASMQSGFGSDYPGLAEARARVNESRAAVDREIDNLVAGERSQATIARASVANLSTALDTMKHQVAAGEGKQATLSQLQSRAATERSIYLSLLEKLRSYDELDVLARADVTELAPALLPGAPLSPRRNLFTLFGFLLSGALAAAAAVWRVNRHDVVRRTADAVGMTGLPCLGIMPMLRIRGRTGDVDRTQSSYGFFREELRSLCALLAREHGNRDRKGISLLITSALPGEGKSTLCRELGRFAAESGVRTLIVRADSKSSRRAASPGSHVQVVDGQPMLSVIDWIAPPTMLGPNGLDRSLDGWQREFSLVLLDTPPISAMAEALILSPLVDATVLVARVERTPRLLLASVTDQIAKSGGRLAGFVLSFVELDKRRGMMPSDPGYYFRENRAYHRMIASPKDPARV